jgi:hypothetical protein
MDMKKIISLLAISLISVSAQAGRPLSVDDANVNDAGVAHVETFWSRAADGSRSLTIAPTYSPLPGLDLILADSRTFFIRRRTQSNPSSQDAGHFPERQQLSLCVGGGCNTVAKGRWPKIFCICQLKL